MRRRLLNVVTVASLVLCAATAALWVRSRWRVDYVSYVGAAWTGEVASDRGLFVLSIYTGSWRVPGESAGWRVDTLPEDVQHIRATMSTWRRGVWAGLGLEPPRSDPGGLWEAGAPHWLVCLIAALLPGAWLVRRGRRRRWERTKRCPTCGYDLRASPERCPECGAGAGAAAAA